MSATIGKGVTLIDRSAFYGCESLVSITVSTENTAYKSIDGNLYTIDGKTLIQYAIGKTDSVFIIPDGVAEINRDAFHACVNLIEVTIPDSVTKIGDCAFVNCTALRKLTIGSGVTTIGQCAFMFCSSLESVVLPNNVKVIDIYAFYGCESLAYIVMGNQMLRIGEEAFAYCGSLATIKYRGTQTQWNGISKGKNWIVGNYEFITDYVDGEDGVGGNSVPASQKLGYVLSEDGTYYIVAGLGACKDLEIVIPSTRNNLPVKEIAAEAFKGQKHIVSVVLGNNIVTVGNNAFELCRGLVSVTVGCSVKSIGTSAFDHCNKLVEVINRSKMEITKGSRENGLAGNFALVIHNGSTKIVNKDGYLFITNEGTNYLLGYAGNASNLIFPTDYNGEGYEIYRYSFAERTDITKVTLGINVTKLQYRVFWRCTGLATVEFIGNESQWEAVAKENNWAQDAGSYTVTYTDE